ncbi:MAG: hydroxyacid dehydrogenase [Candidatus Hydrogenedentales bacterium]|jgi:phosphoglycerate dehydrogenase-like enzyme
MDKALYILDDANRLYDAATQRAIATFVDVIAAPQMPDIAQRDPVLLRNVEIVLTGWGGPKMDASFLDNAPKLKAVFHAAGSIRPIVTDVFWSRGISISSAWAANAIPVAEYTLSQILFALKQGHKAMRSLRTTRNFEAVRAAIREAPCAHGSTVGIVGLGMIGRLVVERLKPFDLKILAYDPYASSEASRDSYLEMTSLEDLFARSDVVSLHAPWIPETVGMITGAHIASMKPNATFINTARGALVREQELINALTMRTDLSALLDVTYPEPPEKDSPLWEMENVFMTPHMAGAMGSECHRMGEYMLEELRRFLDGQPLQWQVTQEGLRTMA